jgi:biofilm PGA synthesis N-glycosyltransferase PgaC
LTIFTLLYFLTGTVFYLLFTTEVVVPEQDIVFMRLAIFLFMAPIFVKYLIQLLTAPLYYFLEKRKQFTPSFSRKIQVSVLVPAWNEEVGILKTIKSVLDTDYKNLELIVINDGSTDHTHELVSDFIASYKLNNRSGEAKAEIKYLNLSNGGKANALNKGLKEVSGEFVITLDADSLMDTDAIINLLQHFEDDAKVGAVAGNVIVANRKKSLALLQQLEYLYGFFFKRADSIFNAVYIIGGAAAAYRKSTLDAVGGFDEHIITEDIEMSTRILSKGYKTRYAANAVIYTEGPSDWKGLCQQRLRWKFGRLLTFIKHKKLFFNLKLGKPYLTCLILPIAVYAEISLLLEGFLLAIFYSYTIYTNDYLPLACVIVFITTLVCFQITFDSKARFHRNILFLAPIAWIVFYLIDVVELQALYRSLKKLAKRQKLEWQSWTRVGLLDKRPASKVAATPKESPIIESVGLISSIDQVIDLTTSRS